MNFFHFLYAVLSLVAIHPSLFKSVLESVLDNVGEPSESRSTDRLTWGKPVPGEQSYDVSLLTDMRTC